MEQYLKDALASLRRAQEEILHPCELYSQLDDMQSALQDIIESKAWEGGRYDYENI
jgi:hypothetical protein